ncbi:MAG: hypothetical protein KF799_02815 [Bdellovibrionales bacterium]|nr:hypothetical protein [Bdellovibrionales bacterium]
MFRLLFILVCVVQTADGATLEQEYVRRLHQASGREIEGVQWRFERIRTLRLACRMQLKENKVPFNCYEAMDQEEVWGLRTRTQKQSLMSQLDGRCQRAAAALNVPPRGAGLSALSRVCTQAVNEAWRIQTYRKGSDSWSEN